MFVVCGQEAWEAEKVGQLCHSHQHDEVYALPWVSDKDELSDNLRVNRSRPNRMWPCEPNRESMEGESQQFDESLGNDALGRMAHLVTAGQPIRNEVMTSPCRSPFYGKVVKRKGGESSTFLLSVAGADKMFGKEPLSARLYAATTVPVSFHVSDLFAEASGVKAENVRVLIATGYLPGSVPFMRFYRVFSGRDFVALDDPCENDKIPVFRYDRGYKPWVTADA